MNMLYAQAAAPNKETVEQLCREYPKGCRVVLDFMEDAYGQAPMAGTQGTVICVDDIGTIHCAWDNGGGLGVAYGADRCHRVATDSEVKVTLDFLGKKQNRSRRCPRCGEPGSPTNRLLALSRRANIMICERCGMREALEDVGMMARMLLMDWAAMKESWWME
jgi:hypothetical protein